MRAVRDWVREKRQKHAAGSLTDADFAELEALLDRAPRQQILYLQAASTSPLSRVVGMTRLVPGERHEAASLAPGEFPYPTVMAAVEDGWRIVQFPVPPTDFRDDRVEYLGFEFILERFA